VTSSAWQSIRVWPPTLSAAVAASAVVHAALLAVPLLQGSAPAATTVVTLQARLAPRVDPQSPVAPQATVAPAPAAAMPVLAAPRRATRAPPVLVAERITPPATQARASDALAQPAPAEVAAAPPDDLGEPHAAGHEVVALSRLGDLLERQLSDYPREVQYPVRVVGAIEATYPAEARAQGIEGTVLAWVVVAPSAEVEEIQIVEGDEIFREPVMEAIRAGRYYSAADGGVGLHFPITLEFRFALDHSGTPQDAAAQVASAPAAAVDAPAR